MPVKFLELVDDPYVNKSNLFLLIVSIANYSVPIPTAPGTGSYTGGTLEDPNGAVAGIMWLSFYQDYEVTGTLSDEAFAHAYVFYKPTMLVPPGFTFKSFTTAVALQGTLEELAPFIRGM